MKTMNDFKNEESKKKLTLFLKEKSKYKSIGKLINNKV